MQFEKFLAKAKSEAILFQDWVKISDHIVELYFEGYEIVDDIRNG